jgi:hypothetical protein
MSGFISLSKWIGVLVEICTPTCVKRINFPKGSSFETMTDEQVEAVMHRLNHRPRKGRVTKHLTQCFLHKMNAKLHELWNFIYDLNPRKTKRNYGKYSFPPLLFYSYSNKMSRLLS